MLQTGGKMVYQYPNIGKAFLPGSSTKGADGNWDEVSATVQLETKCRAEPAKGTSYVAGVGGILIVYSCIVYMPVPVAEIKPGTLFEVWDGERLIVKADVKQFSKGQLNARIWL